MERYYDVMRRIIDLAETCYEGILHIKNKLKNGYFEETIALLKDVTQAFYSIERALEPIRSNLLSNQLEPLTETLYKSINLLVTAYERGNREETVAVLDSELLPSFRKWHLELDKSLLPFITV